MPSGYDYSQEVKQLMFHIINFVESEKSGPVIPLNNVEDRLIKILDISERSVYGLKHELQKLRQEETEQQSQQQEEKEEAEKNVRELRSRTTSETTSEHSESLTSAPPAKIHRRRPTRSSVSSPTTRIAPPVPRALFPQKKSERYLFVHLSNMKISSFLSSPFWTPENHVISARKRFDSV
jgi:hypothetical protein